MISVRDLQHRFHADGRTYVVEICAPGKGPAPVSAGPFDVHIMADVPADFADYANDEPEEIVRHVIDFVRPLVPTSIPTDQWGEFADVVLAWVCSHRDKAVR